MSSNSTKSDDNPSVKQSVLSSQEEGGLLPHILSFLGDQYLFVAMVNKDFWKSAPGKPYSTTTTYKAAAQSKSLIDLYIEDSKKTSSYHRDCPEIAAQYAISREVLEYVLDTCFPDYYDNPLLTVCAADGGNLMSLTYLRDHSMLDPSSAPCSTAAKNGNLDVLKWLLSNNCMWYSRPCEYAAKYGHLDILMYCRAEGCEWMNTCEVAARHGHLDILKWAATNGCPFYGWRESLRLARLSTADERYKSIVLWIEQNMS